MKRVLQFTNEDGLKFITVAEYLVESFIGFKAQYDSSGNSTIEFECDDRFYERMLEEVPRIYRNKWR